jgi:effector-binding domain-containing protein
MEPNDVSLALVVCAALGASAAGAPQEGKLPDAKALLEQMRAALGKPEDLAKPKVFQFQGRIRYEEGGHEGSYREIVATDGRARLEIRMEGFANLLAGCDGKVVWSLHDWFGPQLLAGDGADDMKRKYALLRHEEWQRLFVSARCTGSTEIEGRRTYAVELSPASGPPSIWYLDAESKLPVRRDTPAPHGVGGAGARQITDVSDWRRVDGILHPFAARSRIGTHTNVVMVESVVHDPPLGPDAFALPEKVAELAAREEGAGPDDPAQPWFKEIGAAQPMASIRTRTKLSKISATLAVLLPEVMKHVTESGGKTVGAPFAIYHSMSGDDIDLEAGLPVAEPVPEKGRVHAGRLPQGSVVSVWHVGPYQTLSATHERLSAWLAKSDYEAAGPPCEVYWTDPGMEPDEKKWRTEIVVPVKRRER